MRGEVQVHALCSHDRGTDSRVALIAIKKCHGVQVLPSLAFSATRLLHSCRPTSNTCRTATAPGMEEQEEEEEKTQQQQQLLQQQGCIPEFRSSKMRRFTL